MTRERVWQIKQAVDHNPRGADGYVRELIAAVVSLLDKIERLGGEVEKLREVSRDP